MLLCVSVTLSLIGMTIGLCHILVLVGIFKIFAFISVMFFELWHIFGVVVGFI